MNNTFSKFVAFLGVVALVACAGCGGKAQVSGKVTFSDGTPLTYGVINFENETTHCKGQIEKDGTYKMRTVKPGDGVPLGTYNIYITDTLQFGEAGKEVKTGDNAAFSMIGKATNTIPNAYSVPGADNPFGSIEVKGSMKKDLVIESAAPESKPGDETAE